MLYRGGKRLVTREGVFLGRVFFSFSAAENTEAGVVRLAGLGSSLEFC